jgi:23S rRNA (uracil1939-C5)-methyltransferase
MSRLSFIPSNKGFNPFYVTGATMSKFCYYRWMSKSRRRNKVDTTQISPASITRLSHEGRGIAQIDGKNTFLFGGLPEEAVLFHYTQKRGRFDEGDVTEVLSASPERTTPGCEHFALCGGCSFQHANHALQLSHKQSVLLEQLEHMAHLKVPQVLAPLTGAIWGYRRKARLGVRYVAKKESVLVGFRERKSPYLAQLNSCKILDPKVGELITPLRELITLLESFDKIAQIEVAVDDTRAALVFRNLVTLSEKDEAKLRAFGEQHTLWIYLQPGNETTVYKIYPKNDKSLLEYKLSAFNLRFQFHPLDFVQINNEVNQKLVALAITLLDPKPTDTILDLFCGLGNFTLPLATLADKVIGVEGSDKMVERAYSNAKLNAISNVEFYAANLQGDLNPEDPWTNQTFDKILLDPPRTGAAEIVPQLSNWKPQRIVYVSCNPATLARDAALIVALGYTLTQAGIIDMFPHTAHVESIAVFEKSKE